MSFGIIGNILVTSAKLSAFEGKVRVSELETKEEIKTALKEEKLVILNLNEIWSLVFEKDELTLYKVDNNVQLTPITMEEADGLIQEYLDIRAEKKRKEYEEKLEKERLEKIASEEKLKKENELNNWFSA